MKTKFFTTILLVFAYVIGVQAQDPTVAAPTPSPIYSAVKVISVFSDAYTSIPNVNFNPGWNQPGKGEVVQVAANNTLKYSNLSYQGTDFGVDVNVVPMKFIHLDVWTANENSLQFFLINHAPQSEKSVTLTPLNKNAWNSYDIPLTNFTSQGLSLTNIYQFKVVGTGGTTVYFDNLYFYDNSTDVDTQVPTAFTAVKGAVTYGTVELLLNATDNSGAVNYEIKYGDKTLKAGGVSGVQKSYIVTGLNPSTDYSFSVTAADATGNAAANNPIVVTATTAFVAAPTTSAPTPTKDASKVISIYSNAYTNVANTNFYANWQQNTVVSTIQVGGTNDVLMYANLNYQGTELGGDINASAMTHLHIDVWTNNETMLTLQPLSRTGGGPVKAPLTPLNKDVWNSYDLPLTTFAGLNLTDLYQFAIEGSSGKMIFIDNWYFYTTSTGVDKVTDDNIKFYPNPVIDKMNVKSDSQISEMIISNLLGQTIKTEMINQLQSTIDLTSVSAGNYFITIKLTNGKMSTQKFVKL